MTDCERALWLADKLAGNDYVQEAAELLRKLANGHERGFLDCRERAAKVLQDRARGWGARYDSIHNGAAIGDELEWNAGRILSLTPDGADQRGAAASLAADDANGRSAGTLSPANVQEAQSAPQPDSQPDTKAQPVAWMRRWYFVGEKEYRVRNEKTGRMALHVKFKMLPITAQRCFDDDVPLYANPASQPEGVVVPRPKICTDCGAVFDHDERHTCAP